MHIFDLKREKAGENARKSVLKKKRGEKGAEGELRLRRRGFARLRLPAPASTVFRLIKLSLSAVLNSIFPIPDDYFTLFFPLLVSIIPPSLPLPASLPPSPSRALSFAESY